MKRNIKYLVAGIFFICLLGSFIACSKHNDHKSEAVSREPSAISHYTCPMHPHIHEDKPGECPICHMKLVPVYNEPSPPSPLPLKGERGVTISSERQQLIGIKTETVQKKQVTKEIRTVGRVAFDPELAMAQREFVEIAKNVPSLKAAAISRLKILGMSEEEIRALEHRKGAASGAPTNLYLPAKGDSVWIYATLYQGEVTLVKPGLKAEISFPSGAEKLMGIVRGIDPVLDPMTRSARARIEVAQAGGLLRPDSFVNVSLQIELGEAMTIPKSAIINTGMRQVAFVVHEDRHFQSREIKTGSEVGDDIVVLEGIQEGEKVVSSATFLVDSESQLKAAISSPGSVPGCPEGQAWDTGMNMCMPKTGK